MPLNVKMPKIKRGMSEEEVLAAIVAKGAEIDAAGAEPHMPWYKRILRNRRVKMRYRSRVLIALCIMIVALAAYVGSFVTGTPFGSHANAVTDDIMKAVVSAMFAPFTAMFGAGASNAANTVSKVLTLGPVSYIVMSAVISFVVAGVIALVYSRRATGKMLDADSSNFLPEQRPELSLPEIDVPVN